MKETIASLIAAEKAKAKGKLQQRERACGCIKCFKRMTWANDGICGACREK